MPLLDIASSQPCSCFRNSVSAFRLDTVFRNKKVVVGNDRRLGLPSSFYWKAFCITEKKGKSFRLGGAELWRGRLMIKAVGTLEMTSVPCKNEGVNGFRDVLMREVDSAKTSSSDNEPESSSEDSTEVDEREKLRRMRISKANKGNRPWNKGRKHSPETKQLIKERTRLAMQDPKVKMKLVNLGHAQSEETRVKIGVGVRLGWERRREKLKLQDTCLFEWQNLVSVAARKGLLSEEELQWDSYKILDKQLKQEWLESVEQRRSSRRPKGSKRAPKSAEQKKKISEAIAAKWADPFPFIAENVGTVKLDSEIGKMNYRNRVCTGLAKFHGIPEGVERKPKRKPAGDGETRKRSPRQKDEIDDVAKRKAKIQNQLIRSKRDKGPSYKDPLASTKLEMLKSIRAQRSAAVSKKSEAITRAKLLIAEAEKAAEALEIAAKTSPLAQASLIESRTLIAEATRLIESIGIEDETFSLENDNDSFENSTLPPDLLEGMNGDAQNQEEKKVNGSHSISTSLIDPTEDFSFTKFPLNGNTINTEEELHQMSSNGALNYSNANGSTINTEEKLHQMSSNGTLNYSNPSSKNITDSKPSPNGVSVNGLEIESKHTEETEKQVKTIKKWVRGRLVEVAEEV